MPQDILENLGVDTGITIPYLIIFDVGKDKLTSIPLYRIGVKIDDRECVTIAIPSEEKSIGYLTLAELGLRFKDGEMSQTIAFSDPLIYEFIFEMIPDTYESMYNVEPARKLYNELLILYNDWIYVIGDIAQEWEFSSFAIALMSIVSYNLNSMIFSIFTGMLPYIAFGIRLSLEALVAGYIGDLNPEFKKKISGSIREIRESDKTYSWKEF
ncbi:MAG: hypothetical protein QXD86_05300 [Candidatus Bathyarchaeia archaeon]